MEHEIARDYHIFKPKIYNVAIKYLKDHYLAEDVTQEVLVKLYLKGNCLQEGCKIETWLYRVTTNKCIDYLRNHNYKRVTYTSDIEEYLLGGLTPEDEVIKLELNDVIQRRIGYLPSIYKEVLSLYYFKENSIKEIMTLLNLNISTVKTRIHRGKLMLYKMIQMDTAFFGYI